MHKGYYCHKTSSSLYGGITVEVIFDHLNVINRVNIEGRIDLDPSQYSKAFEDFQERQEGSFLQHCHIVSVELAKNYIEKCFKNRDFSNLFQKL